MTTSMLRCTAVALIRSLSVDVQICLCGVDRHRIYSSRADVGDRGQRAICCDRPEQDCNREEKTSCQPTDPMMSAQSCADRSAKSRV